MNNIHILDHVLIDHKMAKLRSVTTGTKEFRELIEEISTLVAYEALSDIPTVEIVVNTPLESVKQNVIKEKSIALVPILRAGLGMVNGVVTLLPTAKVGHIGMCRNEETLQPESYYCKLPAGIEDKIVIVLDPMLATGGSAVEAINILKNLGVKKIKMMNISAAPIGLEVVNKAHPDVEIYVAKVDRCLNDDGYILPGLGDAGDRIYGTK